MASRQLIDTSNRETPSMRVINQNFSIPLRRPSQRSLVAVVAASLTFLIGCDGGGDPVTTPVSENLFFTGEVTGHVTTGINAKTAISSNPVSGIETDAKGNYYEPAPTASQCASFHVDGFAHDDFVAVIVGQPNAGRYSLEIEVNEDQPAYTNPGTALTPGNRNRGGSVSLHEVEGERKWQQVIGPDGQEPATIKMDASRKSGIVDAWFTPADYSQLNTPSTIHVYGLWSCA